MERLMLRNVLKDVGTKPCNDSYQNVTNAVSHSVEMLKKKNQMFKLHGDSLQGREVPSYWLGD